jgi:Tfp pilus assembly protein PilN
MDIMVVGVLLVAILGVGFLLGWLLNKQQHEIDQLELENKFNEKLVAALRRVKELEQGYSDILLDLSRLKKAGNGAGADDFNRVWAEIRKKLQSH